MMKLFFSILFINSLFTLAAAQTLTLKTPYMVVEIQASNEDDQNLVILKDYPSVLKVKRSQEKVFACLQKSLHENILIKLEITKKQEILSCKLRH